jgi:NADPH:quinone reductase-like Zn-dependent oxidoreductase
MQATGVTHNGRMQAAVITRFGPPETLELRAVPVPVPAAGQVLVQVHAAGMNPVDAQNRADGSWAGITLPAVLGSDGAGTIAALGPGVTGFRIGDPVSISLTSSTPKAAAMPNTRPSTPQSSPRDPPASAILRPPQFRWPREPRMRS